MSVGMRGLYGIEDPREPEIVRQLTEKTKLGKIPWVRQRNAITAHLPGPLEVNFVTQPSILGGANWQLFTIRTLGDKEILRATPSAMSLFTTSPLPVSPEFQTLSQAVDELFFAVNRSTGDDLDSAISTIKNL